MLWIKEVEVAKSVDDLMTSALERIITNQYFRRRINVEEQHAQKIRQMSTRKTDC